MACQEVCKQYKSEGSPILVFFFTLSSVKWCRDKALYTFISCYLFTMPSIYGEQQWCSLYPSFQHCTSEKKGVQCSKAAEDKWTSSGSWESPLYYRWWWFCWSRTEPELCGSRVPRWRHLWGNKLEYTYACIALSFYRAVIVAQFLKLFYSQ